MRKSAMMMAFTLLAAQASAQTVPWARATRVEIALSSFAYAPSTIRLRAGAPVTLHLVNSGSGGHNFAARDFFAAATFASDGGNAVRNGIVEVPGGESRDVTLVPRAGRYALRCTHTLHTAFGMRGTIIVE
jgi:plastocyanin